MNLFHEIVKIIIAIFNYIKLINSFWNKDNNSILIIENYQPPKTSTNILIYCKI